MGSKRLVLLGATAALVTLVADQLLKTWAHAWVGKNGPVPAFSGLNIIATSNTGMAFSIGQGAALWLLVGIALVISAWLFWWLLRARKHVEAIGLGLVIGGALSNVLDRLRFGAVRDFIDLYWRGHHWPAFNLADAAIVTGLALVILFHQEPKRRAIRSVDGTAPQERASR